MQATSDTRLLRDYAETGQEAAFRELVGRYTDFVFAAALRQSDSPDLAADVAQGVFVDLARKAALVSARFPADASLVGWLHRSTRFAVLTHLRDTRRRLEHERQAMEQLHRVAGTRPKDTLLLTQAVLEHAWSHQNQLPAALDAVIARMPQGAAAFSGTNRIDLVYRGSLDDLKGVPGGSIAILRDQRVWIRAERKESARLRHVQRLVADRGVGR